MFWTVVRCVGDGLRIVRCWNGGVLLLVRLSLSLGRLVPLLALMVWRRLTRLRNRLVVVLGRLAIACCRKKSLLRARPFVALRFKQG